jgi:hypothetical protein
LRSYLHRITPAIPLFGLARSGTAVRDARFAQAAPGDAQAARSAPHVRAFSSLRVFPSTTMLVLHRVAARARPDP